MTQQEKDRFLMVIFGLITMFMVVSALNLVCAIGKAIWGK